MLTPVQGLLYLLVVSLPAATAQIPISSSRNSECNIDCRDERQRIVCGTDGRTYKSLCDLNKSKCEGNHVEVKHRGKCPEGVRCRTERAYAQAQSRNVRGMVYIPECREDGSFAEVQCQTSLGYCWCVDPSGKPIPGSSLRFKKPSCGEEGTTDNIRPYAVSYSNPAAPLTQKNHSRFLFTGCRNAERSKFNENLIDIFKTEYYRVTSPPTDTGAAESSNVPEVKRVVQWKFDELDLNKDNSLKRKEVRDLSRMTKRIVTPRQCAKSFIIYCDSDSDNRISRTEWYSCLGLDFNKDLPSIKELHGMRLKHYDADTEIDRPQETNDDADGLNYAEHQDCLSARAAALESHKQDPEGGIYVPECNQNGSYQTSQCHKTTSVCWCVNPKNGKPIRGTAERGARPDCENVLESAKMFKGCSIQRKQLFLTELLKNFKDEMYSSRNSSHSITKTASKDEIVRWKFNDLDANKNQSLDKAEWTVFKDEWKNFLKSKRTRRKSRKLRKCWRNFLRFCDRNNNAKIVMDEWLWCTNAGKGNRGQLSTGHKRRGPNPFSTILKSD